MVADNLQVNGAAGASLHLSRTTIKMQMRLLRHFSISSDLYLIIGIAIVAAAAWSFIKH